MPSIVLIIVVLVWNLSVYLFPWLGSAFYRSCLLGFSIWVLDVILWASINLHHKFIIKSIEAYKLACSPRILAFSQAYWYILSVSHVGLLIKSYKGWAFKTRWLWQWSSSSRNHPKYMQLFCIHSHCIGWWKFVSINLSGVRHNLPYHHTPKNFTIVPDPHALYRLTSYPHFYRCICVYSRYFSKSWRPWKDAII